MKINSLIDTPLIRNYKRLFVFGERDFIAFFAFFLIVVAWSPIFPGVFKISSSMICFPLLLLVTAYLFFKNSVGKFVITLAIALTLAVLLLTLITGSGLNFNRYISLPIAFILCWLLSKDEKALNKIFNLLTNFAAMSIVLTLIAFIYALSGGSYISSFVNPDGRESYLFLTSLSNSFVGNVIRPSFIYDEPGAYSFVLCFIVIFRELLQKKRNVSLYIMIGGLITFSLTHVILLGIYMLFTLRLKMMLVLLMPLIIVTLQLSQLDELQFFFNRFVVVDGEVGGDNRSNQVENYFNVVNSDMMLYGDYKCHSRSERKCFEHGDISSSPVTPIYRGGILFFLIQVTTHLMLIYAVVKNKKFLLPSILLSVLILQRPFFDSYGYELMIYISVFSSLRKPIWSSRGGAGFGRKIIFNR